MKLLSSGGKRAAQKVKDKSRNLIVSLTILDLSLYVRVIKRK